ncbi:unnamed protein product [Durusdinium trenchii]|uniref:Phospholipid-transporting ATPase ABCA1 (ATP-binding cassette sub-family A member 1) (ATP-binding cassette transporter 1) (ABC-1) (ATP-binding cassette 1) (Cholesterol efflux regulatory protein) n=2 Tax=Durusdinium trenchii TaxID=1381693 RepID=A0ABP0HP92_9DINO
MITGVVMEREARLREGMRMMGMRSSAFYASWVATYVLLYLFVVTGVVLLLTVGEILPRSSPSLLFIWLMQLGNEARKDQQQAKSAFHGAEGI